MQSSIRNFLAGIDDLISHLDFEEAKAEYFKDGLSRYISNNESDVEFRFFVLTIISSGSTNGKRFLYNSFIVSLYGYLESFVENMVEEYVSQINDDCTEFSDLPEIIRERHLDLSIDLIKNTNKNKNTNQDEKKSSLRKIVNNINSCVNEASEFKLNEDSFSIHTANFRYDSIQAIFQRIGVPNILELALEKGGLSKEMFPEDPLNENSDKQILVSLLTSKLDDLAQRRNEISHGSLNSDLQSLELYKVRARLIRLVGISIHEVLVDNLSAYLFKINKFFNLGTPKKIFQKQKVLGFDFLKNDSVPQDLILEIGSEIYSVNENSSTKFISGKVVSLRYNNVDCEKILFDRNANITIGVSFMLTSHMASREIFIRTLK